MINAVSVLIPTHNRCEVLRRTLQSLSQITLPASADVELIVVANGCTDQTEAVVADAAAKFPFPVRCVIEPELGLNVARNRALREAREASQVLAFLDDDVWVSESWMEALIDIFNNHPADIAAGQISLSWDAVPKPDWMTFEIEYALSKLELGDKVLEGNNQFFAVGANFAFKRAVVERVGLFVPGLDRVGDQVLSCGETEFVRRGVRAGFRLFYAPRMYVKHLVAPHRATPQYVTNISRGFGQSMIYMRDRFGPLAAAKQIGGHFARASWYGLRELVARLTGRDWLTQRLHRIYSCGAIGAGFRRLAGESPVTSPASLQKPSEACTHSDSMESGKAV